MKLEKAWKRSPDQRFGQFVSNLMGPGPHDVFFTEDDVWEDYLDHLIEG